MKKHTLWAVLLPALVIFAAQPSYGSILIGRVTYTEGSVFTYGEEEDGWVEVGRDTPVGAYQLWVGIYTWPDIERLPVRDSKGTELANRTLLLGSVQVQTRND